MKYGIFLLTALAILGVHAHAEEADGRQSKPIQVGISFKDGSSFALKFLPPDEEGWVMTRPGGGVNLKKNAGSATDSMEIEAYMMRLDAPIEPMANYIGTIKRNIIEGYEGNKNFKINTFEVIEDPKDARCARIHLLLERVQPSPEAQEKRWSEQYVLSCGSLKRKGMGFELRFYHRYVESSKDAQFAEKARKLLDSTVLVDE
ncbi:hypothetical protein AZ34_10805 [Hylemonella gracilis str. Niagara R]|uniref:Secreted protein n=1 Tax=Hylemonella gracilis str. Niagara R TaxID=1458275 RepID=A0A016XMR6_9BURK|nr:hypothetical protein [Hylemonella gracilis]EYC52877.1 hypothetical protein AZ34_10805 [Hylemonella gracilis str. Niagara R]